ncbi:MAG: hypothetical protein GY725_06605 [bacterium]|nr:hypothetical protein [bacterium]
MKLYFLLEGQRTEPRLYRRWLEHALPDLHRVWDASELTDGSFVLESAGGYPGILDRIQDSVEGVISAGVRLDQFFVCLDADEESYHERYARASRFLQAQSPPFPFTVIVQHCCIETWLLGDRSLLRPPPKTEELRALRAHYDVRRDDPEAMPAPEGYATRAQFHYDYLKAVVRDRNVGRTREIFRYSKRHVGYFGQPSHFRALVERRNDTGHLESFGHLLTAWRGLGAAIAPPSGLRSPEGEMR